MPCHVPVSQRHVPASELEPSLSSAVCEGSNATVVAVAAPVEDNRREAGRRCPLRQEFPGLTCARGLVSLAASDGLVHRRRRREGAAGSVVDELAENVPRGAGHDQPRPVRAACDLLPDAQVPADSRRALTCVTLAGLHTDSHDLLTSLSDLAADDLALVAHTLALVRVGLAKLADIRGDLADLLLVDALDMEPGGRLDLEGDALGCLDENRMAEAEGELERGPPRLHTVTHALDLQCLLIAVGHTDHHVGDESAGQPVELAAAPLVVRPRHEQVAILSCHLDRVHDRVGESALRPYDSDLAALDVDLDARGNRDRHTSDTRHLRCLLPLPDVGEDFPTHALPRRLPIGEQTR